MSKIWELNKQLKELTSRAYFLDVDNLEDAEELEEINKELEKIAGQADNIADWLGIMVNDAIAAEYQADLLAKKFAKKKKTASSRVEFFKQMALEFMITHGIKETRGDLFQLSHSLTPGALVFAPDFNPDLLPECFVETIPEHKEPIKSELTKTLRSMIKTDAGNLDKTTAIVEVCALPGVSLVRSESLRIK